MDEALEPFTIAFVPGVTLTRWTRAWEQRQRRIPLAFVTTDASTQVSVLHDALADVSFLRLPAERTGLSLIPLYQEAAVVILPAEHPLAEREAVTLAELVDADRVPDSLSTEDAVGLVAAGGGIIILPQSIARLHPRKDVVARTVTDAAPTSIAIAWLESLTTSRVEEFVGIVRGRTAASSRTAPTPKSEKPRPEKQRIRPPRRPRARKPRGR